MLQVSENGRYSGLYGYVRGFVWARFRQCLRVSARVAAMSSKRLVRHLTINA